MTSNQSNNFLNRELSWLEFNARVLEEAQDEGNPLMERLRFFCIFHSNLDEFFMVRVASLQQLVKIGDNNPDPAGLTPGVQLKRIFSRVRTLYDLSYSMYCDELLPALSRASIYIRTADQLKTDQIKYLDDYYETEIYPVLTPITIDEKQPIPRLPGLAVNIAVLLESAKSPEDAPRLAVVQVPGRLPGLLRIPDGETLEMCWLRTAIQRGLPRLFPGYRIVESAGFRLTRDSELELDDEGMSDFVGMLESELKKRKNAKPIRLEHEAMSRELLARLRESLEVHEESLFPCSGPLDPKPLWSLSDMPDLAHMRYRRQPPILPPDFEENGNIFDKLKEKDFLLHHPFDSFDPVVRLLQAAAEDPDVLAIKQTLYRTSGKDSPIVGALVRAAESGKQVTVLVELTARFDEERNIHWARDLEEAGAHVLYGLVGLKVHAKITLVVRREPASIRRYVHLGTGNYNEKTACLYTDMGLLTSSEEFGGDASAFFNTITGYSEPPFFNRLIMAPNGMRENILRLIRREADWARTGQNSEILAKMNSLVDPEIIRELYAAAGEGVRIRLNIRGICCLKPVPGEPIQVTSIVDRYLEHSRAFVFGNGGNPEVYLSSADWMPRNLNRRVELMFPVLQEDLKNRVIEILKTQLEDNQKSRRLKPDGTYERTKARKSEKLRAQEELYRMALDEQKRTRSLTPERFVPIEESSGQ
jgi:polyphosphate kinase